MSQTEEWDDMSEQTRNEIRARLQAAISDAKRAEYRGKLARSSRTALNARLAQIPTL